MNKISQGQRAAQTQVQKQIQKLSQVQIQGISFLGMNSLDLRDEIYKAAAENPALKIKADRYKAGDSDKFQHAMENTEDYSETLQEHLLHQLKMMNLTEDEFQVSEKLIYNLDENGTYGSNLAPEFLLDKSNPRQTPALLQKCIQRIQQMDPVGTCCRTLEESLFVQACVNADAPVLALFLLDGRLELLNPPEVSRVLEKVVAFRKEWHKKAFAGELAIDGLELDEDVVEEAIHYILQLNPRPAQGYLKDTTSVYEQPDVVVKILKVAGKIAENDYSRGLVRAEGDFHFQIKYASGVLPEVVINEDFVQVNQKDVEKYRRECIQKATEFVNNLKFRENTIILQACAIVNAQKEFFQTGTASLASLTRRQVAAELNIHESSVSRTSNKKNSKYFQTEYGLYPASYFFTSSVKSSSGTKISSNEIRRRIQELINSSSTPLSDAVLTERLNSLGINISRRTVNKYRNQLDLPNKYGRK